MTTKLHLARMAAALVALAAGQAQAQSAFRGDCDQARKFASEVAFRKSYRGVQRMTPTSDACGRDVVALYNLQRRDGPNADYDLAGRYYYLWPVTGPCSDEVHDRLGGTARITQDVRANGLICEVVFRVEFEVTEDEKYGPNRFAKQITLVGSDTSRFAATLPNASEAAVFYEAPVSLVQPPVRPIADTLEDDRRTLAPRDPEAQRPAVNRRQFFDPRAGRYFFFAPELGRYFWEDGSPRY